MNKDPVLQGAKVVMSALLANQQQLYQGLRECDGNRGSLHPLIRHITMSRYSQLQRFPHRSDPDAIARC